MTRRLFRDSRHRTAFAKFAEFDGISGYPIGIIQIAFWSDQESIVMLSPQEKKTVTFIGVGLALTMIASMLLCACGAGFGFLAGIAKGLAQGAGN